MKVLFKGYFEISLVVILSILIMVVAINLFSDPANITGFKNNELIISEILLRGQNVANYPNCNERLVQKYYIRNIKNAIDVIVLGSSRSMNIRSDNFPGMTFFNNSVSGASMEDYLSIFELYLERGFIPKIAILALDPWILNRNNKQRRWVSLNEYYNRFTKKKPSKHIFSDLLQQDKIAELINYKYFVQSVKDLFNNKKLYATRARLANFLIKLADGSLSYEKDFRERSLPNIIKSAKAFGLATPVYSLGDYHELDSELKTELEMLIKSLKKNNIKVIIYLPPYNPITYDIIINREKYGAILKKVESYFHNLAKQNNLDIIGSYNPEGLCDLEDFYDGMHAKDFCFKKIITPIFK